MPLDANRPLSRVQEALLEWSASVRAYLEWVRDSGCDGIPRDASAPSSTIRVGAPPVSAETAETPAPVKPVRAESSATHSGEALANIRAVMGDCRRCALHAGRTQIVFGIGNPNAELMFIGEGPGEDEDRKGEPFVGRAGQLLTEIITKGMKLRREDVYIANIVKCRPPGNRNPEADEIAQCEPFLMQQIEVIGPRIIVALGTFAAQTLLRVKTPISQLRGHWREYQGIKLMPTLHPAYLLRNPASKRLVWEDIKQVMRELELRP